MSRPKPMSPMCEFAGCDQPGKYGALCKNHDAQRRRGQPLHPLGITWNAFRRQWQVRVGRRGDIAQGGYYDDLDDAIEALEDLKRRLR
jgi:hypothetical protein